MFRNYWRSFLCSMGLVAIIFIIFSLAFPEIIKITHLYHMVCLSIPVHLFSFLTLWLKLFSKRIWIRRAIIIAFAIFVMFVNGYVFGFIHFKLDRLIIVSSGGILAMVIIFYVADKIEEHNLNLINQKLCEKNKSNIQ